MHRQTHSMDSIRTTQMYPHERFGYAQFYPPLGDFGYPNCLRCSNQKYSLGQIVRAHYLQAS